MEGGFVTDTICFQTVVFAQLRGGADCSEGLEDTLELFIFVTAGITVPDTVCQSHFERIEAIKILAHCGNWSFKQIDHMDTVTRVDNVCSIGQNSVLHLIQKVIEFINTNIIKVKNHTKNLIGILGVLFLARIANGRNYNCFLV